MHHEVRRRRAQRRLDQVEIAMAEQMDADTEREIEHPAPVGEHRAGAAPEPEPR